MRAVSPVVATIIILLVVIAVTVATMLWITGFIPSLTNIRKLEIIDTRVEYSNNGWTINITVRNTGTKPVTIDAVFINDKHFEIDGTRISLIVNNVSTQTLEPGDTGTLIIRIGGTNGLTPKDLGFNPGSGQILSITIHTASGDQYPTAITLP
ncbi:MAG: DUF4352 domain-containing protein [Thermoprotei archaeon]